MKVSGVAAQEEIFIPFTLSITFESVAEVGQFFALHNHSKICGLTPAIAHQDIREQIKNRHKGLDYWSTHEAIDAAIVRKT